MKKLARNKFCVITITIPAYLYQDFSSRSVHRVIRRAEHAADAVIEVESFAGSVNPIDEKYRSDYHGLIHPVKLFYVNSLLPSCRMKKIDLHSLGFKVRRKRFSIETFTLPPEEDEEQDNQKPHKIKSVGLNAGCGNGGKTPLDF